MFVRLGHIFGVFSLVNTHRGTDIPPHIDTINSDFDTTDQALVTSLYNYLSSYQNAASVLPSALKTIAQNVVTQMANDDVKQTSLTSIKVCMSTLISQMVDASASVQACAASGSVTSDPDNNGNPNIIVSLYGDDGLINENSFNEMIRGTVVTDSQTNGVTAGRESISFLGQYAISDPLSWDYPAGSQCQITQNCIDPSLSQQRTGNNLNNSNFELWTVANIPDSWHIGTGTAGTTVKKSTSVFYDGAASLEFAGNGSELTSIYQQFATTLATGDTSVTISAIKQFAMNAWVKVSSVPAAGQLRFALTDGSGNVLDDAQGNPTSVVVDLTTIGTTFVPVWGFLRTPRILPSGVRFQIKLTTALSAGSSVYIDRLALAIPTPAYAGGPSIASFSGSSKLINGDSFTINIYNNYGGLFQRLFDRFFGVKQLGMQLPSSDTPTIPDSLIV